MKAGMVGAFVGVVIGAILGTAVLGPLGGAVGIVLGGFFGFLIVTPLSVLFVRDAAKTPFVVNCPETHQDVEVTLDPKEATRAELLNRPQHIETCTRVGGKPDCDEACLEQIKI